MATKKQKRVAAEAKRAKFMEELKASNLAALKRAQEYRRLEEKAYDAQARKINDRHARILAKNGLIAERQSPRVLDDVTVGEFFESVRQLEQRLGNEFFSKSGT